MLDLKIKNARIHGHKDLMQIGCSQGKITELCLHIQGEALETIDARGYLVSPPFVDSHVHLDTSLTMGKPRFNLSGTLLEGIQIWSELKPDLTFEEIKARAKKLLFWSIAKGNLAVRSHVDTSDPSLMAVEALVELKKEMAPLVDLQLVAFPQNGVMRHKEGMNNLVRALDKGLDLVGGIPHFEPTMALGRKSVRLLCELAEQRRMMVDMHCDESDDPLSRHIEDLAFETIRLGMEGRVAGSHLTSMHSMDNYYVTKLLPLMAQAKISCICNPLVNMNLQGRQDTYPKRRGLARVPELMANKINVSLGHDDVMDHWYPMGTHDMLDAAHMGAHALHMTGIGQQESLFDAVTLNGARTLNLEGYGMKKGCNADMIILQARSKLEAIRLRPVRLFVIRKGKIISQTTESFARVESGQGQVKIDFCP
ncbi:MAG: amidohydrolase family protein [Desulfobacter sp.]|nr:MAG: amidohydrolase family protein [Desulfobacter sp.]